MNFLHILSESEADAYFYERIAERVTGRSYVRCDFRLRRGSGHSQVMASVSLLLNKFPKTRVRTDSSILIGVDNDRCPNHPGADPYRGRLTAVERRRPSRWAAIREKLELQWGSHRGAWPVDVAVAIPVEMIESWILLLLDPQRGPLPRHSRRTDAAALAYYAPSMPGPQIKDMLDMEARSRAVSKHDLLLDAAECELAPAENVSPSFGMFVEEMESWK